jgi:two-component system, NarL family, response regulator NreC
MRILVLDPQPVIREGLQARLDSFGVFHVVGTYGNARTAVSLCTKLAADIVVMDPDVVGGDGASVIRDLRRQRPEAAVVVFTSRICWRDLGRARIAGAAGFVLKTDPLSTLTEAMHAVLRGETYLSPRLPSELRENIDSAPDALDVLSDREREVFHLVIRGLTNRRIGRELFISPKTVDSHRGRILDKLGCRSAVELVHFAFVNGLVGVRTTQPEDAANGRPSLQPMPAGQAMQATSG